ncbi:MAG: hypothetical protein KJO98_00300 [Rhodothermia bacterium]|nr:hypothetical protein [Rhodothermia bacterium]
MAAAEDAFDNQILLNGLDTILGWHQENATDIVDGLRPGLAVSRIDELLQDAGCEPTAEMRTLWSWRDGAEAAAPFIWYHDFLSVDEAISQRRLLTGIPFSAWPSNYLPAFSFSGEWYGLHCGGDGRVAGPVLHYSLEDEARMTHVNLTTLVSQMAEALVEEAVVWENGGMSEDIQAVYRIHQQHNPGYPFPYYVEPQ